VESRRVNVGFLIVLLGAFVLGFLIGSVSAAFFLGLI
jgi:hypothetical protein